MFNYPPTGATPVPTVTSATGVTAVGGITTVTVVGTNFINNGGVGVGASGIMVASLVTCTGAQASTGAACTGPAVAATATTCTGIAGLTATFNALAVGIRFQVIVTADTDAAAGDSTPSVSISTANFVSAGKMLL